MSKLLQSSFEVLHTGENNDFRMEKDDNTHYSVSNNDRRGNRKRIRSKEGSSTIHLRHRLPSSELRNIFSDFGHCFGTTSIPAAILCQERPIHFAEDLAKQKPISFVLNHPH